MGEAPAQTEQRSFAVRFLRNKFVGKQNLENLIRIELNELFNWIRSHKGEPIVLKKRLHLAVVNTIWTLITGQRYDHDDPQLLSILDQLEK